MTSFSDEMLMMRMLMTAHTTPTIFNQPVNDKSLLCTGRHVRQWNWKMVVKAVSIHYDGWCMCVDVWLAVVDIFNGNISKFKLGGFNEYLKELGTPH